MPAVRQALASPRRARPASTAQRRRPGVVQGNQFHIYDWVNQYFPYSRSPAEYGVSDKPVVMGEFPSQGLTGVSYDQLVESWFTNGYGGSLSWAYSDAMFGGNLPALQQVAAKHACETRY